jgi:hypothetical protein
MRRILPALAAIALLSAVLSGQTLPARPAFEVAAIQVSTRPNPGMRGGVLRGARYEIRNATMVDLIRTAYNVPPERISGGPSWLEWYRFDISALAPENTAADRVREMLKTLLAERFTLAAREDTVTTTALALRVKGAHKLREVSEPGGCQAQTAPESDGVVATNVNCAGFSMTQLAEQLRTANNPYLAPAPVVVKGSPRGDCVGFTKPTRLHLNVLRELRAASFVVEGLKLRARQRTGRVLVVDDVPEKPTPNK